MDKLLRHPQCTTVTGIHDITEKSDGPKHPYNLVCKNCKEEFIIVSKTQMDSLLKYTDIKLTFIPPVGEN